MELVPISKKMAEFLKGIGQMASAMAQENFTKGESIFREYGSMIDIRKIDYAIFYFSLQRSSI